MIVNDKPNYPFNEYNICLLNVVIDRNYVVNCLGNPITPIQSRHNIAPGFTRHAP